MSPGPPFLARLIGVRAAPPHHATISDGSSDASRAISMHMLKALGLHENHGAPEGQTAGSQMEKLVAEDLRTTLVSLAPDREWLVTHPGMKVSAFEQYAHLAVLQKIIDEDETRVLGVAIGRDYEVAPDVTVGVRLATDAAGETLPGDARRLILHASVSCKLTLRSDRAQNVRQEAAVLIRQRHGRLPHVVAVTVEPLPSRIAAIARGTGDVDAVYHLALPQLAAALEQVGNAQQREVYEELTGQRRLLDYATLAPTLVAS